MALQVWLAPVQKIMLYCYVSHCGGVMEVGAKSHGKNCIRKCMVYRELNDVVKKPHAWGKYYFYPFPHNLFTCFHLMLLCFKCRKTIDMDVAIFGNFVCLLDFEVRYFDGRFDSVWSYS